MLFLVCHSHFILEMGKLKRLIILILLFMKVLSIQSGCSKEDCTYNCETEIVFPIKKVMEYLNNNQDSNCNGIHLKLTAANIPEIFFSAEVKVTELSISSCTNIVVNAFNVNALKSMKKLVISIYTGPIRKGMFNGLESLEVLNIKRSKEGLLDDVAGVLDVLNQTLKEFSLDQSSVNSKVTIDGITGSANMAQLENVKYLYNLETSINKRTFSGLSNVKSLDLSYCQIQTIAFGAFDPTSNSIETLNLQNNQIVRFYDGFFNSISNSIQILNLQNNQIASFNDGFFNSILLNNKTQILLQGNTWSCNCDLKPFKVSLVEHSNFVGKFELKCYTPLDYNGSNVITANFCDSNSASTSASTTTFTTSSTFPIRQKTLCISPDKSENSQILIEEQHQSIEILENENGDVIVSVDEPKGNSVLIWFSSNDKVTYSDTNYIDCLMGSGTYFIVNDLKKNSIYTFCLIETMKKTVSPLDCISYVKKSDNHALVWLPQNKKSIFFGLSFVLCGLSTFIGITMGFLYCKVSNTTKDFTRSHRRDSFSTRRTTNTTVQYFLEGNYDAPPLPVRPAAMSSIDEPVYATIHDFATLSSR